MKRWTVFLLCLTFAGTAGILYAAPKTNFGPKYPSAREKKETPERTRKDDIIKIKIATSLGDIYAELYASEVPATVNNFVTLTKKSFYDGLVFHRVIPKFMIQTGDPTGTGTGGPGYKFEDEFSQKLRHDQPGILSMANSGPNTNGSQFFITVVPTPWLDDRHSVFGRVTDGFEVVEQIARVPRGEADKPLETVTMESVAVIED